MFFYQAGNDYAFGILGAEYYLVYRLLYKDQLTISISTEAYYRMFHLLLVHIRDHIDRIYERLSCCIRLYSTVNILKRNS